MIWFCYRILSKEGCNRSRDLQWMQPFFDQVPNKGSALLNPCQSWTKMEESRLWGSYLGWVHCKSPNLLQPSLAVFLWQTKFSRCKTSSQNPKSRWWCCCRFLVLSSSQTFSIFSGFFSKTFMYLDLTLMPLLLRNFVIEGVAQGRGLSAAI